MQGRRQGARTNFRSPPPRLDENQPVKPLNLFRGADSLIEIEQIGAAAQQHMLAVIDRLSRSGMFIRRSAAADVGPALKQRHMKTGISQSAGSREPCDPAAYNANFCPV